MPRSSATVDGMTAHEPPSMPRSPGDPRLGIDIGRVIIDGSSHPQGGDTALFSGDEATMLATPEMPGSFDAIATLVSAFEGRAWLVSKCGPVVQERTLRWLQAHDFHDRTGLPIGQVRFCRRRADKRDHCVELGLTHFVDDHPEVHLAIRGAVEHQYLFGVQHAPAPSYVTPTPTWADVERLVLATLNHPR